MFSVHLIFAVNSNSTSYIVSLSSGANLTVGVYNTSQTPNFVPSCFGGLVAD